VGGVVGPFLARFSLCVYGLKIARPHEVLGSRDSAPGRSDAVYPGANKVTLRHEESPGHVNADTRDFLVRDHRVVEALNNRIRVPEQIRMVASSLSG
jgi:hypothetical protein